MGKGLNASLKSMGKTTKTSAVKKPTTKSTSVMKSSRKK